jgi:hypothetical protein
MFFTSVRGLHVRVILFLIMIIHRIIIMYCLYAHNTLMLTSELVLFLLFHVMYVLSEMQ